MKTRILLLLALLCSCPAWATTYYANGLTSQNINYTTAGAGWYTVQGASCVATGTSVAVGSFANGDVLNLNGCTGVALNVDIGAATGASLGVCGTVTVTVTLTTDVTNGGAATYATATNIVIHANITATKTIALTITGSTGGGTICGNIQGGSVASQNGVSDSHTVITTYLIGNATAGSVNGVYGYYFNGATGGVSITGSCIGALTTSGSGCAATGTGYISLTGSIINGLLGPGIFEHVLFTPCATCYILSPKTSSYTLGTIDANATETPHDPGIANVRSGTAYGSLTGTLSVTGGSGQGYAH
jgi:hypothetical protein